MAQGPFLRRRRNLVVLGPWPAAGRIVPLAALTFVLGMLLYWAHVTPHDLVFHPLHSLREIGWSALEIAAEAVRMLPFLLMALLIVTIGALARALLRGRRETSRP